MASGCSDEGHLAKGIQVKHVRTCMVSRAVVGQHDMGNWLQCVQACKYGNACKECCNGLSQQMTMHSFNNDSPKKCLQGVKWRQPGVISQLKTIAEAAKVRWPCTHLSPDHCPCAHCTCGCCLCLMLASHDYFCPDPFFAQ